MPGSGRPNAFRSRRGDERERLLPNGVATRRSGPNRGSKAFSDYHRAFLRR